MVQVAEKDFNLKMENQRFWDEVGTWHTYMFDRQEKEVEALKSLSLDEFKAHFTELFFDPVKTKRFDLELNSAKHSESQALWSGKNAESEVNTHVSASQKRVSLKTNVETFKKSQRLHVDVYKTNFSSHSSVFTNILN